MIEKIKALFSGSGKTYIVMAAALFVVAAAFMAGYRVAAIGYEKDIAEGLGRSSKDGPRD